MLKNNHIDVHGGIAAAVEVLRSRLGHMADIEAEVRDFTELNEALAAGVSIILLDNMNLSDMTEAVRITAGRAILEASGNVTLENVREIARTGVDIISIGALTHSVSAFDISLRFQ
jgi:nicotinate-nucleotide pyrophosphorylase (carboxylating)